MANLAANWTASTLPRYGSQLLLTLGRMKSLFITLPMLLVACTSGSPDISAQLAQQFASSESGAIDLAQLGPASWQRVCVLAPYTTNQQAELVLGFKWNAEGKTSIASSDGINVLVFVRSTDVVAYVEHSRNLGDFSKLTPRCLSRANAKVVRQLGSQGWVYLVAQNAA